MSHSHGDLIRSAILQKMSNQETIDIYAMAAELQKTFPTLSLAELAAAVSKLALAAPGVAALWDRRPTEDASESESQS